MALSGTITKNVGSYWRLRLEWTATQNIAANSSTLTSKLYWEAVRSGVGSVSASNKSGFNKIHTSSSTFSVSPTLSAGGSKLLDTHTYTVTHNSNGTQSLGLSASYTLGLTLAGDYIGTASLSGTAVLNTIPRTSTLSVTPSWTAGSNDTISVSRFSSSFKHEALIYALDSSGVYGNPIKTVDFSTSQTSLSTSFTEAENKALFQRLNGRSSTGTRIILKTYSGSTLVGQSQRDGTLTAPAASHPTTGYDMYQYVDEVITVPISRANSNFTHTVRFKLGTYTKTLTGVSTSAVWSPSSAEMISMYAQMPNTSFMDGTVEVDTLYSGTQVRDTVSRFFQFHVRGSEPKFVGAPTYADINTATTAITGNSLFIISGKSKVRVTLTAANRANAVNGATMKTYSATLAGKTVNKPWSSTASVVFDFNEISASTNQSLVINAIDSRGKSTPITRTVSVIPYTPPTITASATRVNGFEASTAIKLSAKFSPLSINSVIKNTKGVVQYRTKESKGTVWGAWVPITLTGFPNGVGTDQVIDLDNLKSYAVEFQVADILSTTTISKTVATGQPLFFLDDRLSSVGFGDFPKFENEIMINKRVRFGSNMYAGNASAGESGGGALEMANSDITGINGLWFNDISSNSGEGLLFPNDTTPTGSITSSDYTNFYMRNKHFYVDNADFMEFIPFTTGSGGNGIRVGAGGLTIIGGGESSQDLRDNVPFTPGAEEMFIGSDNAVYITTNHQNGYASRYEWRFEDNGLLYRPRHLEPNGGQVGTIYSATTHDDPMMIQYRSSSIAVSNQSFVDITWPMAFNATPEWVVIVGVDSNSVAFNMTAYSITSTGCRVYAKHVDGLTQSFTTAFRAIACGRKR